EPAKDAVRAFYKPEAPKVDSAPKATSYTKAFADSLAQLAEGDLRVHAITAAMPSGTGLTAFAERFPARFHDTGITEQHAVGLAAGMAKAGLRPVAAIYSTFLQRGYDQVFQEVVLQGLPVVFCLDRAGLVGQDGPTHNGVFDLAYLRTMPGIELCAPRDATDMRRMLAYAVRREGPTAIRFPRGNCMLREQIPELERQPVQAGKAEVLREGETVVLWAYGALVEEALAAADHLSRNGIEVGVVDARFCKPLDVGLLSEHVSRYRHVITVEEHQRAGGFGSAILEAVSRMPQRSEGIARVRTLGIGDHFSEHKTSREEQLADAGIDMAGILRTVQSLVRTKLV
ncbi:MAG: 1-deoxy-D-xylulose-5-phosphate synthase, partial [Planctomycetota bacterium]